MLESVVWTIAVPVTWGTRVVTSQVLRFSLHINWLEGYKWNIVRHVITKSEVRLEIPLYRSKYRVHMTMFIVLVSNANNLPKKQKKTHQKNAHQKTQRKFAINTFFWHIYMLISDSGVEITLICWSFGSWRLSKGFFVCFVFDQIQN